MINAVSVIVKCPLCNNTLMDSENKLHEKPSIKLNIQIGNARGTIRLCSIYGCYDHSSDLDVSDGSTAEFSCPHCNQILNSHEKCDSCQSSMVPLLLDIGGKVVICARKGCTKHYIAFEDPDEAVKRFYNEYGF